MITAMTFLMILTVMAVLLAAESVRMVLRDGRGPQRPPRSHADDPRYHAPGARWAV
jgi:hypothetical protein